MEKLPPITNLPPTGSEAVDISSILHSSHILQSQEISLSTGCEKHINKRLIPDCPPVDDVVNNKLSSLFTGSIKNNSTILYCYG